MHPAESIDLSIPDLSCRKPGQHRCWLFAGSSPVLVSLLIASDPKRFLSAIQVVVKSYTDGQTAR